MYFYKLVKFIPQDATTEVTLVQNSLQVMEIKLGLNEALKFNFTTSNSLF